MFNFNFGNVFYWLKVSLYFVSLILVAGCDSNDGEVSASGCVDSIFSNVQALNCPLNKVTPFNEAGAYSNALSECTFNNTRTQACDLTRLPLLGQEVSTPSIDDVMSRVISDEPWMAENFKKALESTPSAEDIYFLARGVTAIVLSSSIRPAHYNPNTAAIYIDSSYLWSSREEFDAIRIEDDYRSGFGDELSFAFLWRYTKDNQYALTGSNQTFAGDRDMTSSEVYLKLVSLLYHELAHANDYFSPETIANLSETSPLTPVEAFRQTQIVSSQLQERSPLGSETLFKVAGVRWQGESADDEIRTFTSEQVGEAFAADIASHFYGYTTEREDLAMSFEMMMMRYRHGLQMDTVVSSKPTNENPSASDYLVNWGQRDRVLDDSLEERTRFVMSKLLPEALDSSFDEFINSAGEPLPITPGISWLSDELISPESLLKHGFDTDGSNIIERAGHWQHLLIIE